jgi:uncharacterized protein YlxP (DUF503 family)
MSMHVLALRVELRIPLAESLKAKRSAITPILEGSKRRFGVASSELGHQDAWHTAELGFVAISGSARHTESVVDEVERFVWSFPEIEVVDAARTWLEEDA